MTNKQISNAVKQAIATGNWMIRTDRGRRSHKGFLWPRIGKWVKAPDWNPAPLCGGGLHGQGPEASGYNHYQGEGVRACLCETRGERVIIDDDKIKVPEARILLVNDLSSVKAVTFRGRLTLRGCTGLTSLPADLTAEYLDLDGCIGLTSLPAGLAAERLYLSGCTGLKSLPEGLTAEYFYLSGCTAEIIEEAKSRGYNYAY